MNKIIVLSLAFLLFVPLAGALEVNPKQTQNITLQPEQSETVSYSLELNKSQEEVTVSSTNTGNYMVFFSQTSFSSDGDLNAMVKAPSQGNYTHTLSVNFESTYETTTNNTTTTETENKIREIKATTEIPFDRVRSTWINTSN